MQQGFVREIIDSLTIGAIEHLEHFTEHPPVAIFVYEDEQLYQCDIDPAMPESEEGRKDMMDQLESHMFATGAPVCILMLDSLLTVSEHPDPSEEDQTNLALVFSIFGLGTRPLTIAKMYEQTPEGIVITKVMEVLEGNSVFAPDYSTHKAKVPGKG